MKQEFATVLEGYLQAKQEEFTSHTMAHHLRTVLPEVLMSELDLSVYTSDGSSGNGRWVKVPWVSAFHKSVTVTAQRGYYVVYLFAEDMSGLYISLNQGWTDFEDKYGRSEGRKQIRRSALALRALVGPHLRRLVADEIDLARKGRLALGYMAGHVCGAYYPASCIPSEEELRADLVEILSLYNRLVAVLGKDSWVEKAARLAESQTAIADDEQDEGDFQKRVGRSLPTQSTPGPRPRQEPKHTNRGPVWPRDPSIAREALIRAEYRCEVDPQHITFISAVTGQNYVEAHHLIPMSRQGECDNSLDVVANIVALCPTCHRKIHFADKDVSNAMTCALVEARRSRLEDYGIHS